MWISEPFQEVLRRLRQEANLSQRALARQSGVHPGRIAQFEIGIRLPGEYELRLLARALNISSGQICNFAVPVAPDAQVELLERFRKSSPMPHIAPVHHRLKTLLEKYPVECGRILDLIAKRPDREACRNWLGHIPTDSADELLPWLQFLAECYQAVPRFLTLQQICFDTYAVADAQTGRDLKAQIRPCLELPLAGKSVALLFPQVPLRTPKAPCRVDILIEVVSPKLRKSCFMEMDGAGHDGTFDDRRTRALKWPALRFRPQQVLASAWAARVIKQLSEILRPFREGLGDEEG